MNKVCIIILLLIASPSFAAGDYQCLEAEKMEKIDQALDAGVKCKVKLDKAQNQITALKKQVADLTPQEADLMAYHPPRLIDKHWFKIAVGVVIGFAGGFTVGLAVAQ